MRAVRAVIEGRVQGVGFRWSCVQEANQLGVTGWVRNLPSGQVEVWAEGDDAAVEGLLTWCRKGPRFGRVDSIVVRPVMPAGHTGFAS